MRSNFLSYLDTQTFRTVKSDNKSSILVIKHGLKGSIEENCIGLPCKIQTWLVNVTRTLSVLGLLPVDNVDSRNTTRQKLLHFKLLFLEGCLVDRLRFKFL
jgi:hypothetical protein